MKIHELNPDIALADLLDTKIVVNTSDTDSHSIRAYANAALPDNNLGKEFIDITLSSGVQSVTQPMGLFKGYLMLSVYCETNPDNTAKRMRIASILEQIDKLMRGDISSNYRFEFSPNNVLTPTRVNSDIGYSLTVLNISWHTAKPFPTDGGSEEEIPNP